MAELQIVQAADEADLDEKIETQNVEDGFCEIFVKESQEEVKGRDVASEIKARSAERNIVAWSISDEY